MKHDSEDDERAYSRRYTQDGINVLALDRNGRGLFRAQPEERIPSVRFTRPIEPPSAAWPAVVFVVIVIVAIGLAIVRFTG